MATIHSILEDSLFPYLENLYQADFDRLSIRNYGFQAPGLLDPNRARSGYNINGVVDADAALEPNGLHTIGASAETASVLMGKIIQFSDPIATSQKESFRLGHKIKRSITDWSRCEVEGVRVVSARFAFSEDQDRNTTASLKSKWWVLRWQFDLTGYFDV
jgi:hypothetical protein